MKRGWINYGLDVLLFLTVLALFIEAFLHLVLHWRWIVTMTKRMLNRDH